MEISDNLVYKIAISLIPGIGSVTARNLIAYIGSVEGVFQEREKNLMKIPGVGEVNAQKIVRQNVLERAKREVDFIWQEGKTVKELIQVANDLHNLKTKEREIKALEKAMDQFGLKHGLILTQDSEEEIKIGRKIITVKPVYQWLLE